MDRPRNMHRGDDHSLSNLQEKDAASFVIATAATCFRDCISDFSSGRLSHPEVACLSNCTVKVGNSFVEIDGLMERVDARLAE